MKPFFTLLAGGCFFASILQAQITITTAQMPSSADTLRYSTTPVSSVGDYTITGSNHIWDFSTLIPNGQRLREFKPSFSTPYGFFFLPPKFGEKVTDTVKLPSVISNSLSITDIYSFYKKSSAEFIVEGLGIKLNGFPVPNFNSDDDELYKFPLNYLDRDSTTFAFSTLTSTMVPFVYKKRGYRITEVDGYGSITTPYGTANCLRVVTTQYSRDTVTTTLLPSPFNKFSFPNNQRSYQWLTLGEKMPYLEVLGNVIFGVFTPTQVRYRDVIRSFVGIEENEKTLALSVFPNPSTNQLIIITPQLSNAITAQIVDLQGKIVLTEQLKSNNSFANEHTINVSGLAKGLYVLNLVSESEKQSLKISVE